MCTAQRKKEYLEQNEKQHRLPKSLTIDILSFSLQAASRKKETSCPWEEGSRLKDV